MKILLLADINSAHTRRWGEALAAEGITLGILSLNPPGDDWADRHGIRAYSAGIAAAKGKGRLVSKVGYLFRGRTVDKTIRDFKPDILHAHYATSYGRLARRSGMPYLLSVWGSDVFDFPHQHPLNKRMVVRNLKKASQVLATGTALADEVRRLCGRDATVIPFGVDTDLFKPEPRHEENTPFTFVIVKSLEHLCGIDLALRGLAQLEHNVRLVVVGLGTQEAELKELAQSLGIGDRVVFRGWLDNSQVPALLNESDCLLNLSRREGFGVCIVEAMACGVPVIATRTHGAEELIESGQDGLLVPVDGLPETVKAMNTVIQNEQLRRTIAQNGLSKAREHYTWQECVRRMIDVYEECLASGS